MKHALRLLMIGIVVMPAHGASPSINIGSLHEYIDSDRSNVLKRVRNTGDVTAFVRVNVTEMIYDAQGKSSEIPVTTEHLGKETGGVDHTLVASPARLIVPAKGQHAARLIYQGDRDRERYFRVRFVPVVPEKGDEDFALNDAETAKYQSELSAGIQVLTGYGIIVIVRPAETRYDTQVNEEPDAFTIRNQGNTTVSIDNFIDCETGDKACTSPRKIHVLPGMSQRFDKIAGHKYSFDMASGDKPKKMQFGA